ncbi:MAG: hypothetical protein ACRDFB_10350 [Rhabdochlamydiaceae bacterium]
MEIQNKTAIKIEVLNFNLGELKTLSREIGLTVKQKEEEINKIFGKTFTNIVGADVIDSIPEVSAASLKLNTNLSKYPKRIVKPSYLGDHPAVRTIMGDQRPVIAMNIELLSHTGKVQTVVNELVFKRYSLDGDGKLGGIYENNYVSALEAMNEDGKVVDSYLYSSGGMSSQQMERVRDLLKGNKVTLDKPASYIPGSEKIYFLRLQNV